MVDRRRSDDLEKTAEAPLPPARVDRLSLLAIGTTVVTYPLPEQGQVVIGRGETADVRVNEAAISRRHALLHVDGKLLRLEDLGSSNGTRVRDVRLEPHESVDFAPGDLIELGTTMFIVQRPPQLAPPRHVWNHGYFEGRVAEECARASKFDSGLAVLRLACNDSIAEADLRVAIAAATDPSDVLAHDGAAFEILFVGGRDVGSRAEQAMKRLERELRAKNGEPKTGLALWQRDGRDALTLLEAASARMHGAPPKAAAILAGSPSIIVRDARMQQLHRLLERVALGTINVLLLGETGVGKEVMAARVHQSSPRAQRPFVALNCAALSENLLESELFGHERGAFTGAVAAKKGLLESAEGGTVFLDELGELPMTLQVKLLRVLEERAVRRVGGLKSIPIDVRLVSATNRDLEAEVAAGRFRQDLFFRLNGVALVIPPLRERAAEIEDLARSFIAEASRREKRPAPYLSPEALSVMQRYAWPGNVRELRNVVERAVLLCSDDVILPDCLPLEKMQSMVTVDAPPLGVSYAAVMPPQAPMSASAMSRATMPPGSTTSSSIAAASPSPSSAPSGLGTPGFSLKNVVDDFERQRILDALEQCAGNQSRAAKLLGISRNTLIQRLKTYGIRRPRAPGGATDS